MKLRLAPSLLAAAFGVALTVPSSGAPAVGALTVTAVLRDESALAGAHDVEVRDGLAFVAGKGGALAIIDIRDSAAPALRWSVCEPRLYEDAQTVLPLGGGRLLVGARDVHVFDTTEPMKPIPLGSINNRTSVDRINGFARLGDAVFGANKSGFVFAIDVASRDRPRLLGARPVRERDDLQSPHDVAFAGELLVVVDGRSFGRGGAPGCVAVYRVIDRATRAPLPPEQWTQLGAITDPRLAGANRVMTRGAFAYVGSSLSKEAPRTGGLTNNVSVVDLTNPTQPRLRGHVRFPDERGPNGLEVAGPVVFAAGGQTVQAIDVTDPDAPRELAHLTDPAAFPGADDDAHDLVHVGGKLFVTAQTSHALVIIELGEALRRRVE